MKNLHDRVAVDEVKARLQALRPDAERQWGRMAAPQMVAHCAAALELALGDRRPRRLLVSWILGPIIKPLALGDDAPLRRNSPTLPELMIPEDRELDAERRRLTALIDRFAAAGPAGCTTHPHAFFGPMTPRQWAILMYKHLDHHLRQFGA